MPGAVVTTARSQPEEAASANVEAPTAMESNTGQQPETTTSVRKPDSQRRAKAEASETPDSDPDDEFVFVDPDDGEKVVIKKDGIHVGDMKVQNGKVYMPDGRVYEMQKTPTTPLQPGTKVSPRIPPIDMRHFTPEQRRKLRMLREQYPDAFPAPMPPPSPKPKTKATNQ